MERGKEEWRKWKRRDERGGQIEDSEGEGGREGVADSLMHIGSP